MCRRVPGQDTEPQSIDASKVAAGPQEFPQGDLYLYYIYIRKAEIWHATSFINLAILLKLLYEVTQKQYCDFFNTF